MQFSGLGGTGFEDGDTRITDPRQGWPARCGSQVAHQEQVDDVAGPVVDGAGWLVRIGHRVELLGNLRTHRDPGQAVRVGQAETGE